MNSGFLKHICSETPSPDDPVFIIYSTNPGPRLIYACDFIFRESLKVNFEICHDKEVFASSPLYRINYSDLDFNYAFTVRPAGLLSAKGIPGLPAGERKNDRLYFFGGERGDLHFDIFSAVFFLISRAEEWRNFEADKHGRFGLKESILYKSGFHLKPVTDLWVQEFKQELLKFFESISFKSRSFQTLATIDVDNLYAFAHKGFLRTLGAGLRDLLKFDFANITRRNRVINQVEKDPFDIYTAFSKWCHENNLPLIYFFLFNTGNGFDRTLDPSSPAFVRVLDEVKKSGAEPGLHPGYFTCNDASEMKKQCHAFSKLHAVKYSRQHYLRFDIKRTPYLLMENGIEADFSMGFASGAGFRAGTTLPFYFYDFNKEEKTSLLFVPFCAMDGAYFIYDSVSPEKACDQLLQLKNEIRDLGGNFITVFHERTFAEHLYPGFAEMYKKVLLA